MKPREKFNKYIILIYLLIGISFYSCTKVELRKIDSPAYLRVFNDLRFKMTLEDKNLGLSVVTMLINPEYNESGEPISAEIVGDYLITRNLYAAPHPSFIGNSIDRYNPEYPGKEVVMAGPILNGFDLSTWAQVPSGKHRVAFYLRPKSEVPFFSLEKRYREKAIVDTTIDLAPQEVYTMHVLQKDFETKEICMLLRQENFHKLALSDTLVYVNFYNYSAKGFYAAPSNEKPGARKSFYTVSNGFPEDVHVYFSLFNKPDLEDGVLVEGYDRVFMTNLLRDNDNNLPNKYHSIPLRKKGNDSMKSDLAQVLNFAVPWVDIHARNTVRTQIIFYKDGNAIAPWASFGTLMPNMIVSTHSGVHNPRSFGTVNSFEIVNGDIYLTTVQRVYDRPIY